MATGLTQRGCFWFLVFNFLGYCHCPFTYLYAIPPAIIIMPIASIDAAPNSAPMPNVNEYIVERYLEDMNSHYNHSRKRPRQ